MSTAPDTVSSRALDSRSTYIAARRDGLTYVRGEGYARIITNIDAFRQREAQRKEAVATVMAKPAQQRGPEPSAYSARTPEQQALVDAEKDGQISARLVKPLFIAHDPRENLATVSQAAEIAARQMAKLETDAYSAINWRTEMVAVGKHVLDERNKLTQVDHQINDQLARIYDDPAAALKAINKHDANTHGPGELATDVSAAPHAFGALRGGMIGSERAAAKDAVPKLKELLELRGRYRAELRSRQVTFNELRGRPEKVPALMDSLVALSEIESVRKALPSTDPLSSKQLRVSAHEAAIRATSAEIAQARGLTEPYRRHLEEQKSRVDLMSRIEATRNDPSRAVETFMLAKEAFDRNLEAARRLDANSEAIPAKAAANMAATSRDIMKQTLGHVLADRALFNQATESGAIKTMNTFAQDIQRDLNATRAALAQRQREQELASQARGRGMG